MKAQIVILLSFLILLTSSKDLFTYVHYQINKEYISNTFCVNLDKPEVMCNGVCYLKDSILKNHESDSELPFPSTFELLTINFVVPEIIDLQLTKDNKEVRQQVRFFKPFISKSVFDEIFRPPQFT